MKQTSLTSILILAFCCVVFSQTNKISCPEINISMRNMLARADETVFVIAEIGKEINQYDVKYQWTVAKSKILEGQGTKIISVLRSSDDSETVTLEIIGLPKECNNFSSESIPAIDPPEAVLLEEFGEIKQGDKKARIDMFFKELQNNPLDKGLIVISQNKETINQLRFYDYYLTFRKLDKTLISFVITNELKSETKFFRIPTGAYHPTFKNNVIIKAEEFDKLYNLFQPKPIIKNRRK